MKIKIAWTPIINTPNTPLYFWPKFASRLNLKIDTLKFLELKTQLKKWRLETEELFVSLLIW